MIFIAQAGVPVLGFLFLMALAATLASLISIGFSFSRMRRHWFVPLLAFPSFVFGVALTVVWFTHDSSSSLFLLATGANVLFGTIGIGRWVFNQAQ